MNLALNVPINSVSFGQTSIAILREFYSRNIYPNLFPIGGIDLRAQKPLKLFEAYVHSCAQNAPQKHKRSTPSLKLWHINQSLDSFSNEQFLITFHETDQLTQAEINILNNQRKVLVTSNYTKFIFQEFGVKNVEYFELGFDSTNFWPLNKRPYQDDRIVFGLYGKLEHRKHHLKTLRAWAAKYGNNPKYVLHAAIFNPFLSPEDQTKIILHGLEGKKYWNINFIPYVQSNVEYNEILNSADIVLAMSGNEGFGLPEFHSVALGKHCVGLNAHSYKGFLNDENAVLISHSDKIPVYDGIFFHKDQLFNQGNIYNWKDDEFIDACEKAIERVRINPVNTKGIELQKRTYSNTFDQIKKIIENV